LADIAVVFCSVAQHLADLRQRRALSEHLGRRGVPQPVSAYAGKPRPRARLAHDPPGRVRGKALKRCCHAQKQRPALAPRAAAQIRHHRFTDIDRNGNTSCREPLPRIRSSPARQSTSSSRSRAISQPRSPILESSIRIATCCAQHVAIYVATPTMLPVV